MIPRRETPSALQLSSVTPTLCGSQIFYPEVALCPTQAASSNPSGYSNVCHALALVEGLRWAATAPRYAALHCAALYCAALHCSALHCTVLCCTTLHCTTLHYTVPHCTALYSIPCPTFSNQPKCSSPSRSSTPPIDTSGLSTSLAYSFRF